jgi:hypothetical protein
MRWLRKYPCRVLLFVFTFLIMTSCATAPKTTKQEMPKDIPLPETVKKEPTRTENEKKSLETFMEILHITRSTNDRQSILPRIESLYTQVINDYPETPLAQESYWRLITIYLNDYSPPDYEKATALYKAFIRKFTHSPVRGFIEDDMGRSYMKHDEWNRLLTLCTPAYRKYIDEGIVPRPSLIYMYAEANFALGNMYEAAKAYESVTDMFPGLHVGRKSAKRLEKIRSVKE